MIGKPTLVRTLAVSIAVAAVMLSLMPAAGVALVRTPASSSYVTLDGSPGFPPVADPNTDTVYVPIQCQNPSTGGSCNHTASDILDLLDSRTCTAHSSADCQVVATAVAGTEPTTATVDRRTDTIFVGDAGAGGAAGAVTVVDGTTCNVSVRTGCATPIATIKLGSAFPAGLALDPATGTLYVADSNGAVDVLNVSHCNAASATDCGAPVQTITDSLGPIAVAVDVATDTVYVANGVNGYRSDTVSVIDGATCNAIQDSGCGQTPTTVTVGSSPQWDAVDQRTDTVYVANASSGSVSLINGATCNGTVTTSCGQTPPAVETGTGDNYLELDGSLHSLFSLNQDNDTMSEINIRTCNALTPSLCPVEARNEQVPFDPPTGEAANSFAIAGSGATAYIVNAGGPSLLQPISIGGCNARDASGCRVEAPHVPQTEFFPVVDATTHTIYSGNVVASGVDVFNADTCRAGQLASCSPVAVIPTPGPQANIGAIDDATHTLYVGNPAINLQFAPAKTVSVVDIAHCTATDTSGCDVTSPTIRVGTAPGPPVLDTSTDTLYVPYGGTGNRLAVISTRHCNAEQDSGCHHESASVDVPAGSNLAALSQPTDTVYEASYDTGNVVVINGATCNASDHTGCAHIAALVPTGDSPSDVLVNDATDTLYVDNGAANDTPGSVSMINTAECSGSAPSGCAQSWPTVPIGRQPQGLALDTATGDIYAADEGSAGISVIDGNACNATTTSGCPNPAPLIPTAGGPTTLAVAPWSDTVYAGDAIGYATCCGGTASMGVFKGRP
ncbi:MAG TPA: hypothetical protein VMF07_10510 [Solirubrobacteraceae bacterium]|nr:hypothetical protein [Solirubrobacteraceae bacterium]